MATKPVTLEVQPRGNSLSKPQNCMQADLVQGKRIPKLPTETSIYIQGSSSDLYQRIAAETGCSVHRLRITKKSDGSLIPNDKKATIASLGVESGTAIQVKDLGMSLYIPMIGIAFADSINQARRLHGGRSS